MEKDPRRKQFGIRLRRFREEAGATMKELAHAAGVSYNYVRSLESGIKNPPSSTVLENMAEFLGVTVDQLLSDAPRTPGHRPIFEPVEVPFLGRVPANYLRWMKEEGTIEVVDAAYVAGVGDPAIVEVSGECLSERSIITGDHIIIDRAIRRPRRGDIVVVRVGDEVTMKEWHPVPGGVELRATNPKYSPVFIGLDRDDVEVIGVARRLIRDL